MTIATFFQWHIKPGQHEVFQSAWTEVTRRLLEHGSLGSALFVGPEGTYCALARWPDKVTRDAAFAANSKLDVAAVMRAALSETVQQFDMDEAVNLWSLLPSQ